jgi:hypothetical protein
MNYVSSGYVRTGYVRQDSDTIGNFTFDGSGQHIFVNSGVRSITCVDMYSRWVEWVARGDNMKYLPAIRTVGGDQLSDTKNLGISYFLQNGWDIHPANENHVLNINGNLYTSPAGLARVHYPDGYTISVEFEVSNLVDSTLVQQTEVEYIAFGGGVTINVVSGKAGTAYPMGTPSSPVNNLADALLIIATRGFSNLFVVGNLSIASGQNITDLHIFGQGATLNITKTLITLVDGCITTNATYTGCRITGKQGGESNYYDSIIDGLWNAHCHYERCGFILPTANPAFTLQHSSAVGATHITYLHDCYSDEGTAVIDRNGTGQNQLWDNFSGRIKFINQNKVGGINYIWVTMNGGTITIDSTCTTGNFVISGNCTVINNSGGSIVNTDGVLATLQSMPTASQNADAVWNKPISGMTDKTTIGGYISKVLLSIPKFLGLK